MTLPARQFLLTRWIRKRIEKKIDSPRYCCSKSVEIKWRQWLALLSILYLVHLITLCSVFPILLIRWGWEQSDKNIMEYEENMNWDRTNKYQRLGLWITKDQLFSWIRLSLVLLVAFGVFFHFYTNWSFSFRRICDINRCIVTNK